MHLCALLCLYVCQQDNSTSCQRTVRKYLTLMVIHMMRMKDFLTEIFTTGEYINFKNFVNNSGS